MEINASTDRRASAQGNGQELRKRVSEAGIAHAVVLRGLRIKLLADAP